MGNRKEGIGPCGDSITEEERLFRFLNIVILGEELKPAAEQAIEKLEKLDDYPTYLTEVVLNPSRPENVRIFASEKLTKFVKAHWCTTSESFVPPEINSTNKTKIRELLLAGLSQTTIEVRTAVADLISVIGERDWPDNWPSLIATLVTCLNGESRLDLHGALLVFNKLHIQQTNHQGRDAVATIMREMNRIFGGENYSEEIRCLACETFCETVAQTAQSEQPDMIRLHMRPAVVMFRENLMRSWTSKYCTSQLKICILESLTTWLEYTPKYVSDLLADMLPLIWETLIDCAKVYQAYVVNGEGGLKKGIKSATKMDDYSEKLVEVTFRFIEQLLNGEDRDYQRRHDCRLLKDEWFCLQDSFSTPRALRHLLILSELTEDQIEQWKTDFKDFVQKENFRDYPYDGIRETVLEVIDDVRRKNRAVANSLIFVIMKYMEEENERRINSKCDAGLGSWKSHEAFLLAFSLMKDLITSKKNGSSPRYDVLPLLENIVLADLNDSASHPLLVGRCLSLGGIYSDQMPSSTASAFLEATVNGLKEDQPPCVKISAARAVYSWYDSDNSAKVQNQDMLVSHVPAIFEGLFALAKNCESTHIYVLVLEGISALMPVDEAFTASVATRIYFLVERALLKYDVAESTNMWETVFKELTVHKKCVQSLQSHLTNTLLGMMTKVTRRSKGERVALDIVQVLVKHSIPPLSNFLIDPLLPATCNCIVDIDDCWTFRKSGIKVIEAYLSSALQQVIYYQDANGRYGAQYILQVIVHGLNQKSLVSEIEKFCGILILLIKEAWYEIRQGIDELVKTLIRRMYEKQSTLVSRELLMVYAHLIHRGSETVFNYLAASMSLAEQKSFLETVIAEGFCKEYYSFDGEKRETINFALGKVLEHGVTNPSSPLHQITLKGFRRPIPLLVKICRLTINDQSSDAPTEDEWIH